MTYTATVTREGRDWLAEVRGLPGAHAYARTLTRLRAEIAEAVILADDLDDDATPDIAFELSDLRDELAARAFAVAEQRRILHQTEADVVAETTAVARLLVSAGWSVRDAAGALDVSPGRISQLVS